MQEFDQGFYIVLEDVPEPTGLVFGRMQCLDVDTGGAEAKDEAWVVQGRVDGFGRMRIVLVFRGLNEDCFEIFDLWPCQLVGARAEACRRTSLFRLAQKLLLM